MRVGDVSGARTSAERQRRVSGNDESFMDTQFAKDRRDPLGMRGPVEYMTDGQLQARHERMVEAPAARQERDSFAWFVTLTLLPSFMLLLVIFFWFQVMPSFASPYRSVLMGLLPDAWFSRPGDTEAQPLVVALAVGVLLVVLIIGLFLLRRRVGNAWARGRSGRFVLWLMQYPISVAIVLIIVLSPALIFTAVGIARSSLYGGESGTLPSWPLILTVIAVLWWSFGTTRRAGRRATRFRYRDWLQAADGTWYPPGTQFAPASYDQFNMPCYPPSSHGQGPLPQ